MSNQMYQKRELIEVIIKEKTYVFDKSVFSNSDLDILIAKGLHSYILASSSSIKDEAERHIIREREAKLIGHGQKKFKPARSKNKPSEWEANYETAQRLGFGQEFLARNPRPETDSNVVKCYKVSP